DIEASGLFEKVVVSRSAVSITYDGSGYLRLLGVYPGYIALPEKTRQELFDEFARAIAQAGSIVPLEFETMLYVARKKRRAPTWARLVPARGRRWGKRIL